LLRDIREQYATAKASSYRSDYPRPRRRLIVDVLTSKNSVEAAVQAANAVLMEFEDRGYRVVIAPEGERWRRPKLDPRRPEQAPNYGEHWGPLRPTLVYIGTLAIGLSIYELSERAAYITIGGKHVVLTEAEAAANPTWYRGHYVGHEYVPTGRFVVRAYSPYGDTTWQKEWEEKKPGQLPSMFKHLLADLLAAGPTVVEQVKEAKHRADIEAKEWEERRRRWAIEEEQQRQREAEARRVQARKDSLTQLVSLIDAWSFARSMETFFREALDATASLSDDEKATAVGRLERARSMFGSQSALERFRDWKVPEEHEQRQRP
jgi:hypothetical protein